MSAQFSIDFDKRLPVEAQIGMQDADDHADVRWKRWTDAAILAVARRCEYFTVDEVVEELHKIPNYPTTHNDSALGPRMKEVSRELKYMDPTSEVRRSKRPASHGNLLRVWRSNVFRS